MDERTQSVSITDDLDTLLAVLPPSVERALRQRGRPENLLEIILDLGRPATARYTDGEVVLTQDDVPLTMIEHVVARIGEFDADNRAGMPRTLHRISAIRNRRGHIVGLTCRVGRAVYGTSDIILDIIKSGKSVLMLGKPGVGKTTLLREAARVLADDCRVIIVDTSNEIGGDGDIAHPAVGRGRRMQVATPALQHEVMIEAVENHNPQVIIIDEIGRELEAQAARTIAERGVQLIGTAHGNTLENLLLNPTLSDLVGGIESVTLSDEEARRRGTQKTVLERRAPPTFEVLVEIQDRDRLAVHLDVAAAVDAFLRGRQPLPQLRTRDTDGKVRIDQAPPPAAAEGNGRGARYGGGRYGGGRERGERGERGRGRERYGREAPSQEVIPTPEWAWSPEGEAAGPREPDLPESAVPGDVPQRGRALRVYPYGVARNRLEQAARRLRLPLTIVEDIGDAEGVVTLKSYYRQRPSVVADAERHNIPIYVLRSNTVAQIEHFLADMFNLETQAEPDDPLAAAIRETQEAVQRIQAGARSVDLAPQSAYIRRRQHQLARQANLISHSYGKEPFRRVRIYRE
jgi:stage III sporulation protein SpoIIIAA